MASRIQANGIDIAYELSGPEGAPAVVLSNSLSANFAMWDAQVPVLARKYRVLRYDQRGHGATEATPGPYTIELLADDVHALIGALGLGRVHFVGLSMGGFTAQMLALRHPGAVASLALCDTACVMPPPEGWDERIATAREKGLEPLVQATMERWFTPPFHIGRPDELRRIRDMTLACPIEGYIGCCEAIRDMFLCDRLDEIAVPTLIVVGAEDPGCPVTVAEALNAGIPESELVVIEGAAHLPNIERTEEFNAALLDFLDRQ